MTVRTGIVRTDAVVLRSMDFGETSRIVTLFTLELGKVTVVARGARSSRSRFGSTLDAMAHIQAIIYVKPSRSMQTLSDASHVSTYPGIRERLDHIEVGLRSLELVHALVQENYVSKDLFELIIEMLWALGEAPERARNLLYYFQLQLASILGFSPSFEKSDVEQVGEGGGALELETGAIQAALSPGTRASSRSALRAFAVFARSSAGTALQLRLRPDTESEVAGLVDRYLRYHFEEAYPDRSSRVFAQFESG